MIATGRERMARLFRLQAEGCANLGSLLYARLLDAAADDIDAGGVVAEVLSGHEGDPGPSALALRLAGAVHRIVLDGRAPTLAAHYPSMGGTPDDDTLWPAFVDVVDSSRAEIRERVLLPPQTNEIGRSAVLIGGLLHVVAATGMSTRLFEVGASAGLNLGVDRFHFDLGEGVGIGPADSPVVLSTPWVRSKHWPPTDPSVVIVDREGCDPAPIDPTSDDGRLQLASYVWPDQVARFDRLTAACAIAREHPARLVAMGAVDYLTERLAEPVGGVTTVVWHSVVMQYLTEADRKRLDAVFAAAGRRATAHAPLVRLSMEPRRQPDGDYAFVIAMTTWPRGRDRVLGTAGGHGPPVRWR
jgi:hypothetical protein